jgi:hypothetical protein
LHKKDRKTTKEMWVVHTCNPSYVGGVGRRVKVPRLAPGKKLNTLSKKQLKQKKGWGCGSGECEVLSSNPTTAKKKKKKEVMCCEYKYIPNFEALKYGKSTISP